MQTILKRTAFSIKPTNQNRVLWISLSVSIVGLILTTILVYLGIYKPNINWITSILLVLLSITFCLAFIYVLINAKINRKLVFFIPMALMLLILLVICVDSFISIVKLGYIKCDLCP